MTHDFPTLDEVLVMHEILIREFGGSMGLRDIAALDSALMRPQLGYYDSLIEEASALLEGLAMNYPFIDDDKRVACASTETFLRMNGHFIDCDSEEAYDHFMQLFETNTFRFAELHDWLEEHVRTLPGS